MSVNDEVLVLTPDDGTDKAVPPADTAARQAADATDPAPALAGPVVAPAARIYGQPMDQLPLDLYIPPDALAIMLDAFEGPLDLLLYLIRKANVDVLDIPMAPLTRQYLEYVEIMRSRNLELAADYLVMAAMLLEIKSRMLLPRPKAVEGEEVEDPRAELVRRLIEYEQMKQAALAIDALPQADRDFAWVSVLVEKALLPRHPDVSLLDLQKAWGAIVRQAKLHQHHKLQREELSVREHMTQILRSLHESDAGGTTFVEFTTLFNPRLGVSGVVVHFLAMLELAREHLIGLSQAEAFAPIYVRLAFAPTADGPAHAGADGVADEAPLYDDGHLYETDHEPDDDHHSGLA